MTIATIFLFPGRRRSICGVSPISFTIRMVTCLVSGIALAFIALALSIPPA